MLYRIYFLGNFLFLYRGSIIFEFFCGFVNGYFFGVWYRKIYIYFERGLIKFLNIINLCVIYKVLYYYMYRVLYMCIFIYFLWCVDLVM